MTTEKLCENCKHWGEPIINSWTEKNKYTVDIRECGAVKELWECIDWEHDGDQNKISDQFGERKAFAKDGSDYMAKLITRPDFGCVQFENKNQDKT